MDTAVKFPVTLSERLELDPGEIRIPATLAEFAELLDVCEYPIEFQNDEIIAMSIASDYHETIVANLLGIFGNLYTGNPEFRRYGSNRHVFIPEFTVDYAPDMSIIKGKPIVHEYHKGKTANTNPWLLVEIMSESTRQKDWGEKLPRYKKIPSLQYILYIEQDSALVTLFSRSPETGSWGAMDYEGLGSSFPFEGEVIGLKDVYENAGG